MVVVKCGPKNGHLKNMRFEEIGLYVQNMLIILDSIVDIIGRGGGGSICSFKVQLYILFD